MCHLLLGRRLSHDQTFFSLLNVSAKSQHLPLLPVSLTFWQRDAAPDPPIDAFGLEENICNGVSVPCGDLAIILDPLFNVRTRHYKYGAKRPFVPNPKSVAHDALLLANRKAVKTAKNLKLFFTIPVLCCII